MSDGNKVNKFLLDRSLRIVNTKERGSGEGALHIVARRCDALYLRALLQADDVNPNIQDARGNTALLVAIEQNWSEGVGILIKYRANVNLANTGGETPLIRAVQMHNADIVASAARCRGRPRPRRLRQRQIGARLCPREHALSGDRQIAGRCAQSGCEDRRDRPRRELTFIFSQKICSASGSSRCDHAPRRAPGEGQRAFLARRRWRAARVAASRTIAAS